METIPPFPDNIPLAYIPKISLKKLKQTSDTESSRLYEACCKYGFFHLDLVDDDTVNGKTTGESHGFTESVSCQLGGSATQCRTWSEGSTPLGAALSDSLGSVFRLNKSLHEDISEEEKTSHAYSPPKQLFGHKALGRNRVEGGKPDRYEAWTFARDDILDIPSDPALPSRPPLPDLLQGQNKHTLQHYLQLSNQVIDLVCTRLESHLGLLDGELRAMQNPSRPSQTSLRFLRYLPHPADNPSSPGLPDTNASQQQKSLVGHTDIGSITILAHNGIGGLQILPPGLANRDENWAFVPPEPGCVIVNLGDAMVEWSGGILRSDLHRVVAAPGPQRPQTRWSVAYLVRPESRALMTALRRKDGRKLGDGEEDGGEVWTAIEWERKKSEAIINGKDVARSKGGLVQERERLGLIDSSYSRL